MNEMMTVHSPTVATHIARKNGEIVLTGDLDTCLDWFYNIATLEEPGDLLSVRTREENGDDTIARAGMRDDGETWCLDHGCES